MLHRLDRIVKKLCERCHTFSKRKPKGIKSFVTAFRKIHALTPDMDSSYIPNYDDWDRGQKVDFLYHRGLLKDKKELTGPKIDELFKTTILKKLKNLEKDLRNMS